MKTWLRNAAVDAASWTLARVADVLLGRVDGAPYTSMTSQEAWLETATLEELQREVNRLRTERRRYATQIYVECPNCGPVCICRGGFRL